MTPKKKNIAVVFWRTIDPDGVIDSGSFPFSFGDADLTLVKASDILRDVRSQVESFESSSLKGEDDCGECMWADTETVEAMEGIVNTLVSLKDTLIAFDG